jgi:hypothetical protein
MTLFFILLIEVSLNNLRCYHYENFRHTVKLDQLSDLDDSIRAPHIVRLPIYGQPSEPVAKVVSPVH